MRQLQSLNQLSSEVLSGPFLATADVCPRGCGVSILEGSNYDEVLGNPVDDMGCLVVQRYVEDILVGEPAAGRGVAHRPKKCPVQVEETGT